MRDTVYLIADAHSVLRMTKRPPSLGREEVGVTLKIAIPDSCFRSPLINASIDVPPDRVILPTVEAEVGELPALEDQAHG